MHVVGGDDLFLDQRVGPDDRPFDGGIALADVPVQPCGRLFVVGMGWQQGADQADHAAFREGKCLLSCLVAHAGGTHQDEAHRRSGRTGAYGIAQSTGRVRHQPARRAVDALEMHGMPETGRDRAAAVDAAPQRAVIEVEQVRMHEFERGMRTQRARQLVGRSHHGADLLAAFEELRYQSLSRRTRRTHHQNRHSLVLVVSSVRANRSVNGSAICPVQGAQRLTCRSRCVNRNDPARSNGVAWCSGHLMDDDRCTT